MTVCFKIIWMCEMQTPLHWYNLRIILVYLWLYFSAIKKYYELICISLRNLSHKLWVQTRPPVSGDNTLPEADL